MPLYRVHKSFNDQYLVRDEAEWEQELENRKRGPMLPDNKWTEIEAADKAEAVQKARDALPHIVGGPYPKPQPPQS